MEESAKGGLKKLPGQQSNCIWQYGLNPEYTLLKKGFYLMSNDILEKRSVVITTINQPTEAIIKYSNLKEVQLCIVADRKTDPSGYQNNSKYKYIGLDEQRKSWPELFDILPFDHYSRKMFGYLSMIQAGAQIIIDTDDDNIPYEDYQIPLFEHEGDLIASDQGFVNPLLLFTNARVWPRGLPINQITNHRIPDLSTGSAEVGVWQGLADGDPDVDAIYRIARTDEIIFRRRAPIVISTGSISPFNSQNTVFRREVFPLLYLPSTVTFRYTDILRGIVAQPILWAAGFSLGYFGANVFQIRNSHDLMEDFVDELPMYLTVEKAANLAISNVSKHRSISENLYQVYCELLKEGIVKRDELERLRIWINYSE